MADFTEADLPGNDSWIRSLLARLTRAESRLQALEAQTGSAAGSYDESGITIGSGSYLTGTGPLDWNGPASFNELINLNGNIVIGANGIAASAVDSQASASSVTNSAFGFAISRTSWTSLVSVDVPRPAWATRAVIFATAFIAPYVAGQAYSYVRARVVDPLGAGPTFPAIFNQQTPANPGVATAAPWKGSVIENPGATITCRAEAIHEHTANSVAADGNSAAGINVIAVWLRGT